MGKDFAHQMVQDQKALRDIFDMSRKMVLADIVQPHSVDAKLCYHLGSRRGCVRRSAASAPPDARCRLTE